MKMFPLAVLATSLAVAVPALARPFTAQDLVSLSRVANPAVSPDGHWLVWDQRETDLAANGSRGELWRLDLTRRDAAPARFAPLADADESDPAFGPDGQLYFLCDHGADKPAVWRVGMTGAGPTQVTGNYDIAGFKVSPAGDAILVWADRPVGAASLDDVKPKPAPDQGSGRVYDQLFVRHWDRWEDGQRSQLFVIAMASGHAPGPGHAIEGGLVGDCPQKPAGGGDQIAWSPDGRTVYFALREAGRIEALSDNLDIFAAPADGSAAPSNLTRDNLASDTLPAVSPDGRWLAWAATTRPGYEDDRRVLMLREIATGRTRALTENWDRSVDSIAWAPNSSALYVTAPDTMDKPVFRVDLASGAVRRLTGAGHAGAVAPAPRGTLIYTLDGFTAPADIWRLDAEGAAQLTHANAAKLAGVEWPAITRFTFKGAGDDVVWGFAMRPAGLAPGAKAPVAFLVHGGPQNTFADAWSYRLNPAVWTGHGYAVVSVDFHGSTGYGQAFTDSIHRDWGGKPLTDLQIGLKAASERFDFLDVARSCAAGGSYGGYMMNWIEGNWPDGFKCLVQHDGIFDARAMNYETDELWSDDWDHGGHAYYEAPDEFEKWNPVNDVAKWKTPQLVITSERDFRSPYTQGVAAFTALQRRDVPSRLLVFPDETHVVVKPRNSLQWYAETLGWMDRWTGGASAGRLAPAS